MGFVEIKSIWEPADVKEKKQMQDYRRAIIALIKEYGGIDKVMEAMTQKSRDEEEGLPKSELNHDDF